MDFTGESRPRLLHRLPGVSAGGREMDRRQHAAHEKPAIGFGRLRGRPASRETLLH